MNQKESLKYTGSLVLGLSDAIVEMLGALTGLTFALQDTSLIAAAGFITGVAASFSMAASEYLSTKEEGSRKPVIAGFFTGSSYLGSVILLVSPFLFLDSALWSWVISLLVAVFIILVFNLYISHEKKEPFRPRFVRMISLSFTVAFLSFLVGLVVNEYLLGSGV